jgi:hypothetical protein
MALSSQDQLVETRQEYETWAQICEDKHGLPWPIPRDRVEASSLADLLREIKKLKVLGRTPHE